MQAPEPFVDIHCHLIPAIDDGSKSWDDSLAMARMAVDDGFETTICTPHQMGTFAQNDGDLIRQRTDELQQVLDEHDIPLEVLPGGDVRIEPDMIDGLRSGSVMSLADQRKHVLLELPHEVYFPLEQVLDNLRSIGMVGILSHPERNEGLLRQPELLRPLVERGCLMQVTAGSLMGTFGPHSQQLGERMLCEGLVHFLATDAHSSKKRRPLMQRAFEFAAKLVGWDIATDLCCRNPAAVADGDDVEAVVYQPSKKKSNGWFSWARSA